MTNGSQQQVTAEQRQAWLTEYQVCQEAHHSHVVGYWTLSGIFIGFTSVLLGGLILGILSNESLSSVILNPKLPQTQSREFLIVGLIVSLVSMAVLIILYFLKRWLVRIDFLIFVNYLRMHEIELRVGMRQGVRIKGLEHWESLKDEAAKLEVGEEKMHKLKEELNKIYRIIEQDGIKYERPSHRWHHKKIFLTLFGLWSSVLVGGLLLLYFFHCVATIVTLIIIAAIWIYLLTRKHHLPTDFLEGQKP